MTAPTEPLVTSLEEALRRLHENGRWLEPSMVGNGWLYSHSWTVNGSPNVSGVVGTGSYPFPRPGRFLAHSEDEALREAASDALDSLIEKTVGFPRSMRTWLEGYCGARVTSDTYQPTLFGGSP